MEQMTVKQAIDAGYTCALGEDAGYYVTLEDLANDKHGLDNLDLFLGSKETFKFSISEKAAEQLFEEYIDGQDEVNNEPEHLYDQLKAVDWKAVVDLINPHFVTEYHSVTDIKLISPLTPINTTN